MPEITAPVHLRLPGTPVERAERLALRAALVAARILGLATGTHLRLVRGLADPLTALQARLQDAELRARLASEAAELLAARFSKIPEGHNPTSRLPSAFAFSSSRTCSPAARLRPPAPSSSALTRS